jgi:hypothetical protein
MVERKFVGQRLWTTVVRVQPEKEIQFLEAAIFDGSEIKPEWADMMTNTKELDDGRTRLEIRALGPAKVRPTPEMIDELVRLIMERVAPYVIDETQGAA